MFTAAALSLLLAVPAHAAGAVNVTPGELNACSDGAATSAGGWDTRQYLGDWTIDEAWAFKVRPRTVTLGELCVSADNFAVPYTVDDLPTEGSFFEGGEQFSMCDPDNATVCYTLLDIVKLTNGANDNVWTACFKNEPSFAAVAAEGHRVNVTYYNPGASTTNLNPSDPSLATYYPTSGNCGAATGAERSYIRINGGSNPSPVVNNLQMFDTGPNVYVTSVATELPSFWGDTQGATMAVGGTADPGAEVKCSTSANGPVTSTTTLAGFNLIDQDDLPIVDEDGENPVWTFNGATNSGYAVAGCAYVVAFAIHVCNWDRDFERVCKVATWTSARYSAQVPYTDDPPIVAMCREFPSNPNCLDLLEPEITCEIEYSDPGNPITVLGEFFGGLGAWVGCMVIPVGWDRADAIAKSWASGEVGELQSALDAAIPNGIECGSVLSMTVGPLGTIALSTCDVDFAPLWVKSISSGVIILGIAALAIKRIMWSVGSKG